MRPHETREIAGKCTDVCAYVDDGFSYANQTSDHRELKLVAVCLGAQQSVVVFLPYVMDNARWSVTH
jgi:hypothetical protein